MKPIDQVSLGIEDPALKRVEEMLRSAADFEPETEPNYNFAAAAMCRRRFRARSVWLMAAGMACTAALVYLAVPRFMGSSPIFPPSTYVVSPETDKPADEGPSGVSIQPHLHVRDNGPLNDLLFRTPRFAASRNEPSAQPVANRTERAPKAKWETEAVDRFSSQMLKPTFIERRNPDGSRTLTPAVTTIPIQSGERPAVDGGSDMGVMSFANYESSRGEGTK